MQSWGIVPPSCGDMRAEMGTGTADGQLLALPPSSHGPLSLFFPRATRFLN